MDTHQSELRIGLVFAGGLGLGAYQAGAYEKIVQNGQVRTLWIAGSSVGAVNGALIAGSYPENAVAALRKFWSSGDLWAETTFLPGYAGHIQNWLNVFYTRLFGAAGHFRPRMPNALGPFRSLYDLTPMRQRLERLVDFGRLNSGEIRLSVATTDIETGELVVFDTANGDELTLDHLLASCGFLPEFAPVDVGGRLLGDGGLSANAPIEPFINDKHRTSMQAIFVIDLFARDGARPRSLEAALARKNDLLFGNQSLQRLQAASERLDTPAVYLSYKPTDEEAGPEKTFDLSRKSIEARWAAGAADMESALRGFLDVNPKPALMVNPGRAAGGNPARVTLAKT